MAGINALSIKQLRERTQVSLSDCKAALVEAEGDMEKAVEIIWKKGLAENAQRNFSLATEGEVRACVSGDKQSATIVEINIQTDFAAQNEAFKQFVGDVLTTAAQAPEGSDLNNLPLGDRTVGEMATDLADRIGEKIIARRWQGVAVPAGKAGLAYAYVHLGGKIGVILALETNSADVAGNPEVLQLADEIALQVATSACLALRREEVSEGQKAQQQEIYLTQLREDPKPKPAAIWPKIVEGKLQKWLSEVVLLEQESLAHPGFTIAQCCEAAGAAAGGSVAITHFVRFERGEGIV